MAKFALSSFITSEYEKVSSRRDKKTNPKQSQSKPNFILDVSSLGFLSGDKPNSERSASPACPEQVEASITEGVEGTQHERKFDSQVYIC